MILEIKYVVKMTWKCRIKLMKKVTWTSGHIKNVLAVGLSDPLCMIIIQHTSVHDSVSITSCLLPFPPQTLALKINFIPGKKTILWIISRFWRIPWTVLKPWDCRETAELLSCWTHDSFVWFHHLKLGFWFFTKPPSLSLFLSCNQSTNTWPKVCGQPCVGVSR